MSEQRIEQLRRALASKTTPEHARKRWQAELDALLAPPPPPKPKAKPRPAPKPKTPPPPPPREFTDEEKEALVNKYKARREKKRSQTDD